MSVAMLDVFAIRWIGEFGACVGSCVLGMCGMRLQWRLRSPMLGWLLLALLAVSCCVGSEWCQCSHRRTTLQRSDALMRMCGGA
jgi:hypothetical protein